jgi:hypothetical protein
MRATVETVAIRGRSTTAAIAILPESARSRYAQLLEALQEAYAVRFVGADGLGAAAGVVVFPGGAAPPRLALPCLTLEAPEDDTLRRLRVELSRNRLLDRPLQGRALVEEGGTPAAPLPAGRGQQVLACVDGKPAWTSTERGGEQHEHAAAVPTELEEGAFLRDHLKVGRFWALLPLAHFVKRVCGNGLQARPFAACFVIDDANVRSASYGYVRYSALARDARDRGYHVAVATIPLDLVLPPHGGVRFFADSAALSLVVHGNDHVYREMERARSEPEADKLVGSADARVRRFEERANICVERVMCPPHGYCGPETLAALFRWGFQGLLASAPFPWHGFSDHRRWRLGGWLPAQLAGGTPVLPRYPLTADLDDLVFRAFLGQPLILYCHHDDLREGFGPFHTAVDRVAELGGAHWQSLASIAGSNAVVRESGETATITVYSRDARIRRPNASLVRVEIPRIFGHTERLQLVVDDVPHELDLDAGAAEITFENAPTGGDLRIRLEAPCATYAGRAGAAWRPKAWPLARRAISEARDRALPLVHQARRPTASSSQRA